MDTDLKLEKSTSCSSQLEKSEDGRSGNEVEAAAEALVQELVVEIGGGEKEKEVERMEFEDELDGELDSVSLEGVPSVSSSILSSPNQQAGQQDQGTGNYPLGWKGAGTRPEKQKRLSEAQLRRLNWYLGKGHSIEAAHELALLPPQTDGNNSKRPRSKEQTSLDASGQGAEPRKKRAKAHHNTGQNGPKPGVGITYKEMAEATPIAVIPREYPEQRLTKEQLGAVRTTLLDLIGSLESPDVRPNFRSCEFRQGYLQLACGDAETASWLKVSVPQLKPWAEADLEAIDVEELPKLIPFIGYFHDSRDVANERIIQFLENQNKDVCTKAWRAIRRNEIAKTVELLLEVDEISAEQIGAMKFHMNYMFGKARLRRVTGESSTSKRGNSDAQLSNNAETGKVLQKSQGQKHQPPVNTGTVQLTAQKGPKLQPPAFSKKAGTGTVRPNTNPGGKPQPPVSGTNQKPPKGSGRQSVAQRLQALGTLHEEQNPLNTSEKAAGSRHPNAGKSKIPDNGGVVPGQ